MRILVLNAYLGKVATLTAKGPSLGNVVSMFGRDIENAVWMQDQGEVVDVQILRQWPMFCEVNCPIDLLR